MGKIQIHTTFLCRDWLFAKGFEPAYLIDFPEGESVDIPHANVTLPYNHFSDNEYQFISSYKKTFSIKKNRQKRYILHFDGIMTYAEVYVNKTLVVSHKGGYTPFSKDVTKQLITGDNEVVVMVDSTERDDIPPFGFVVDYLTYGGIYRDVYLEEQPLNYIEHALIHVDNDVLHIRLLMDVTTPSDTVFTFNVYKDNQLSYYFEREYDLKKKDILVKEPVYLDQWKLNDPKLYELEIKVGEQLLYKSRFANRKISIKSDGFYLNDKRITLFGLNRHQSFPYIGYAMPRSAQRKDADILKYELGVNVVRSSHYPPSKYFLERCDEIGLLVFDEIPGWQHIGDDAWKQVAYDNVKEMILRDYNHPSVFIWGVRINESPDDEAFYLETNRIAKLYDESRPTGGVRNIEGSQLFEDVYTFNDFVHHGDNEGLKKPKTVAKKRVPYMVNEYNGHMFPTKKYDDEVHRIEQVKRHLQVQEYNFKDPTISGAIGWCMFDYNTHRDFGSGDRVCYHGVLDMFRIPKDAAYAYKMIGKADPFIHVTSRFNIGDREASEIKDVLVLSNVESIKFYINDEYIKTYYPESTMYPHLPHAPFVVDDFIGNLIHDNEEFSDKDASTIKSILLHIMKHGMKLPLLLKLKMFWIMRKHKMTMDQAAKLYETYVGKWGLESVTYRFDGYNDQVLVVSQSVGPNDVFELVATADDQTIIPSHTYETTRVVIRLIDAHKQTRMYVNTVLRLKTNEVIDVIGPTNIALIGGSIAVYVRSNGTKGTGVLTIQSDDFQPIEVTIKVE